MLDALGQWGASEPAPGAGSLTATAVPLSCVAASGEPGRAGGHVQAAAARPGLDARAAGRLLAIEPGDPKGADAGIRTDPLTLNALLLDPGGLNTALATSAAEAEGDVEALRQLLTAASPEG